LLRVGGRRAQDERDGKDKGICEAFHSPASVSD
jgi:hypothetical protein